MQARIRIHNVDMDPDPTILYIPNTWFSTCEGGPACRYLVPALDHEAVHAAGAVLGTGQQLTRADHLDDLLVGVAVVRLQSVNNSVSRES